MKTAIGFFLLLCTVGVTQAQHAAAGQAAGTPGQAAEQLVAHPLESLTRGYQPIRRGAHHEVLQKLTPETNLLGQVGWRTNSYTHLETGMHRLEHGAWVRSEPQIQITGNRAVGLGAQHRVEFESNLNKTNAVHLVTSDGLHLRSRIMGIAFYDYKAETNVLIAEVKDCEGELVGSNQVVYPHAFTDVDCDVRYTFSKAGLEQDVIFRERPPLPEQYGLNPETTRLEIWTEFFNPPAPKRHQVVRKGWRQAKVDERLDFGSMSIVPGTAFEVGMDSTNRGQIRVQKQWVEIDHRTFLVEDVPFQRMVPGLRALPPHQASIGPVPGSPRHRPAHGLSLPAMETAHAAPARPFRVAAVSAGEGGFVMDYNIIDTGNDFLTFSSGQTYLLSGPIWAVWASIEGGTVIKYAPGASLDVYGTLSCTAVAYQPAVFTASDDQTVGESVSSVPQPTGLYADCALSWESSVTPDLSYLHIRYATCGLRSGTAFNISHSQFVHCGTAIYTDWACFGAHNILMNDVDTAFDGAFYQGTVEHLTYDQGNLLANAGPDPTGSCDGGPNCSLSLVNSLLVGVASEGNFEVDKDMVFSPQAGETVFQTAVAGMHYLASDTYRNRGSLNVSPWLQDELRHKTTYPPLVYANETLPNGKVLCPQAQRDTTALPDIGYHYEPLDYILQNVQVEGTSLGESGTLTLTNGVSISTLNVGISTANVLSGGSATNLNRVSQIATVQEQPLSYDDEDWVPFGGLGLLQARFTEFNYFSSQGAVEGRLLLYHSYPSVLELRDCQLHNAAMSYYLLRDVDGGPTFLLRNNLLQNCLVEYYEIDIPADLEWNNNLFLGGTINLQQSSGTWDIRDNMFYLANVSGGGDIPNTCNAFTGSQLFDTPGTANMTIPGDFAFATGPLGGYYQTPNSPFLNKGSRLASEAGLYHYTVTTDQSKETTSTVDIGFHYVACSTPTSHQVFTDHHSPPGGGPDPDSSGQWWWGNDWNWVASPSFSGNYALQCNPSLWWAQNAFYQYAPVTIHSGDKFFCYVYIDYPPDFLALSIGSTTAYWGVNPDDSSHFTMPKASEFYMGPVPETGEWVRLEVPAGRVGWSAQGYNYVSISQGGGSVTWDYCGVESYSSNPVDTDGDGIPDYQEDSNGNGTYEPDADLSDWQNPFTDGTGMDDGWEVKYFGQINVDPYADPDGDGFGNLEEYQNGTNPLLFNSPPKSVTSTQVLHDSSNPNNINVSWTSVSASVTSYTITRTVNGTTTTYTVPAGTSSWTDTSVPAGSSPTYTVTPNYPGGSGAPSTSGNADYNPTLAVDPEIVRGPTPSDSSLTPLKLILGGAVPPSVAAIRVYKYVSPLVYNYQNGPYDWWLVWYAGDYGWYSDPTAIPSPFPYDGYFDVPVGQFVNGVYQIPVSQLPEWCAYYFQTQPIGVDGRGGVRSDYMFARNVPFVDGSAVLKDNLLFILRAGERGDASHFDPAIADFQANINYASVSPLVQHMDISPDLVTEFAAFNDNWFMKNWAYDGNFRENSDMQYEFWWDKNISPFGGYYADAQNGYPKFQFDGFSYVNTPNPGPLNSQLSGNPPIYLGATAPSDLWGGFYSYCWPCYDAGLSWGGWDYEGGDETIHLANQANLYGLQYQNVRIAWSFSPLTVQYDLPAGGSYTPIPEEAGDEWDYWQNVTAPVLATKEYYFTQATDPTAYSPQTSTPMPNDPSFTTSQTTPLIITAVGKPTMILGWAKQQISNGSDSSKFGYLGQYFDKAYKTDANGNATSTETGILSEYGDFFATEPGRLILKTKPDADQGGQQGQCTVYAVSLNVDANHDGTMDRTYSGPDTTSPSTPMRFWINNDNDGNDYGDGGEVEALQYPDSSDNEIKTTRDLEDFARLWISGVPALPAGQGYSVSLSWASGGPVIQVFPAFESDGGTMYLTDETTAKNQILGDTRYALGKVTAAAPFVFPDGYFSSYGRKQFLFEGVSAGSGQLVLTISQNGKVLAQSSVWMDLHDVKDLYEQAHVNNAQTTWPAMVNAHPLSTVVPDRSWNPDPAESKQLIVYVHGWRMTQWDYYSFSETMFKRLYWQGYQGRFASLRWPTLSARTDGSVGQYLTFNRSEHIAFDSANGAAQYLVWLRSRFSDYTISVAAHSQGNIVMMEALKQMMSIGISSIDNYVLMQAAVPAQCYDVSAPNYPPFLYDEATTPTPNTYFGYPGAINNALRPGGLMINFFNPLDYAVGQAWVANQNLEKPEGDLGYYLAPGVQPYRLPNIAVTDPYEIMAFEARPRSQGAGTQGGLHGVIQGGEVNLNTSFAFGDASSDHSGEFNRNIQVLGGFYQTLLGNLLP